MPIVLEPVKLEDFDTLATYGDSLDGDLSHPTLLLTWPVDPATDPETALVRSKWSADHQREIFLDDPTARFIKVVDTDVNEIISLARWHYYENGFQYPEFLPLELNGRQPDADSKWPKELHVEMHKTFITRVCAARPEWAGNGPQWVLTTLVTRSGHRKKGAGRMLSQWGVDQAIKDGVPAFVEASMSSRPLYESCGFKEVGKHYHRMEEYGVSPDRFVTRMVANLDNA